MKLTSQEKASLLRALEKIKKMPPRSRNKSRALVPLVSTMKKHGFKLFKANNGGLYPGSVGEFFMGPLPKEKTGHLRPYAGQTALVVCVGSGEYRVRFYMAGCI